MLVCVRVDVPQDIVTHGSARELPPPSPEDEVPIAKPVSMYSFGGAGEREQNDDREPSHDCWGDPAVGDNRNKIHDEESQPQFTNTNGTPTRSKET